MIQDNCFISAHTFDKRWKGNESHVSERPGETNFWKVWVRSWQDHDWKINRVTDQTCRQMNCSSKTHHTKMGFPSVVMSCVVLTKTFTAEWVASCGSLTTKQRE